MNYAGWIVQAADETNGNVDLSGFFFRRAFDLLRTGGAFGLIATNTIRQGDTRVASLSWICNHDGHICAATKRIVWPGIAAVVISVVHVCRGVVPSSRVLDGRPVSNITAFLFDQGTSSDPVRLATNQFSFIGCDIKGQGFLFDDRDSAANSLAEKRRLCTVSPTSAKLIRPYMSGEDVNTSPDLSAHRFVVDFADMKLEAAAKYPELLAIARARVLPERLTKSRELAEWPWWRFWRTRKEMRAAIAGLRRMLVTAQTGNAQAFALLPTRVIPSHSVVVIASESLGHFSVLQSQVHQHWAAFLGPSLKDDRRYAPSDCFETFAFPGNVETSETLERTGREYYDFRAALMVRNNEGLTKTYNRFHDPDERDPDILRLRDLHAAMDRAVLDAYGWTDIQPRCEFILDYEDDDDDTPGQPSRRKKPWRYRWPDEIRDEVLGRLLELNAERALLERAQGEGARQPKARTRSAARANGQSSLLE